MYRTNYLFLVFIATLAIGVGYLACELKKISYPELALIKYEKREGLGEINKIFFNKISLSYPKDLNLIESENSFILNQYLGKQEKLSRDTKALNFSVSYLKNGNPKALSLENWFKYNVSTGIENQKKEKVNVAGKDAYKQDYYSKSMELDGYFIPIVITVINNSDVYQIFGYELPENPDPSLTPEDIQAAHEYEAIFNQILSSLKFID